MAQVLSDLNETFFDLAVKKFCGSSLALRGYQQGGGPQVRNFPLLNNRRALR
jgi:hypothetical protein